MKTERTRRRNWQDKTQDGWLPSVKNSLVRSTRRRRRNAEIIDLEKTISQWQVLFFFFLFFWRCRELTHPSLSATCCFSSHLISRVLLWSTATVAAAAPYQKVENFVIFPFYFSLFSFSFSSDRFFFYRSRVMDGHEHNWRASIHILLRLSNFFLFFLSRFDFWLLLLVIAWISPSFACDYSREPWINVGRLARNLLFTTCLSYIPTFDSCAAATAGPRRKRTCRSIDVSPDITSSGDYMRRDDVDDRQQCHPSIHPAARLFFFFFFCVSSLLGEMMKQTSLPHTQRWIDPFLSFFFFGRHGIPSPSINHRKRKISSFLVSPRLFQNFSQNVDRRKMSLANQWAMIIGVICSTHTSQKK